MVSWPFAGVTAFSMTARLSTLNTPQILVLSYVYQLPFYRNQSGGLGMVLGGWELSGIVNFQSGSP